MGRLKGAETALLKQTGKFFRFFVWFYFFCCLKQRWFTFCCRQSKIREVWAPGEQTLVLRKRLKSRKMDLSLALGLGTSGAEVLHGQFGGEWLSPPSPPRACVTHWPCVSGVWRTSVPEHMSTGAERKVPSGSGEEGRGSGPNHILNRGDGDTPKCKHPVRPLGNFAQQGRCRWSCSFKCGT